MVSANSNSAASKFKYNGKELEEALGLNWLDYGARNYEAALGRWMNMDPLAEKYTNISPFAYVANTPIQAIDPDGRAIIFIGGLRTGFGNLDQREWTQKQYKTYYANTGIRPSIYRNDIMNYWSTNENYHGRSASIDGMFKRAFNDNNAFYLSGSSTFRSSAKLRQQQGARKAKLFHNMYGYGAGENQKIKKGEAIRIVGHSQGGAHAAGFLSQLLTYKDDNGDNLYNVEVIFYLNPHQPGDIVSPSGVDGVSYQAITDQITGDGLMTFLGLNGGSAVEDISGTTNNNMRVFKKGEEGTWLNKRGGHNVTDGDQNIRTVINNFCKNNPTKCTEIKLIKKN